MSSNIQLLTFLLTFLYGILSTILFRINAYLIKDIKKVLKDIITILFTFDIIIIYSLLMYRINGGIIHIYFVITLILGMYIGNLCKFYVNKK